NKEFIEISKKKYPNTNYYCLDILSNDFKIPKYDYVIMNGIFTVKRSLSFDDMFNFMKEMIKIVSIKANIGFAFNVMSKQVDWERDDLFHLPFDSLASFLTKDISRNFIIRNDYGLYEYTVYVYPNDHIIEN
ncbi:MAG: SAM-dependent methyltransferase, partial [Candidatus Woesearchaeota archaeon]